MKKLVFVLFCVSFLYVLSTSSVLSQELPEILQKTDAGDLDKALNDAGFVRLYEQMTGRTLSRETLSSPGNSALPFNSSPGTENSLRFPPEQTPQHSLLSPDSAQAITPLSQNPLKLHTAIVTQQLGQLEQIKTLLLNDLRHAETCGYHAIELVPRQTGMGDFSPQTTQEIISRFDVQTAMRARKYVPSHSNFDWAIHGEGFFVLRKQPKESDATESPKDDEPLYYTRAGRFELTADRKLALKHGGETYLLQPEIDVPPLFGNEEFRKRQANDTQPSDDWHCSPESWQLAHFDRPERLQRIDGVLFAAEPDGETPELFHPVALSGTTVHMQQYEASNVDFTETLAVYRALHHMQSAILNTLAQ